MSYTLVEGTRAPLKVWANPEEIEPSAMVQLRNTANLPWAHGVAVMPDVHFGKGATVGSVIAMKGAVSPAAVGVDIGCGMSAVPTDVYGSTLPDDLSVVRALVEKFVPVGIHMHDEPVADRIVDPQSGVVLYQFDAEGVAWWREFGDLPRSVQNRHSRASHQIGTLGGGNHFLEMCLDDTDRVWLMLHSGSRNIGKEVAGHHISIAQKLDHNAVLPDRDLAVFLNHTPQMEEYRRDLYWCQEYALRNRQAMLALMQAAVSTALGRPIKWGEVISCHHNYVSEETYDGVELLVTRKGAISTAGNALGIIPGSMGTGSYIVRGLGNVDAYQSASHGAGRRMSRTAAKKAFTVEDLKRQTMGVECRKDQGVLDEIPGAYKNLETVMSQQKDLVDIVHRLRTIVCVKG